MPGTRIQPAENGQYFIDFQVPYAAINSFLQSIGEAEINSSTKIKMLYGTSQAANLSVINKEYLQDSSTSTVASYSSFKEVTGDFSNLSTNLQTTSSASQTFEYISITGVTGTNPVTSRDYPTFSTNAGITLTGKISDNTTAIKFLVNGTAVNPSPILNASSNTWSYNISASIPDAVGSYVIDAYFEKNGIKQIATTTVVIEKTTDETLTINGGSYATSSSATPILRGKYKTKSQNNSIKVILNGTEISTAASKDTSSDWSLNLASVSRNLVSGPNNVVVQLKEQGTNGQILASVSQKLVYITGAANDSSQKPSIKITSVNSTNPYSYSSPLVSGSYIYSTQINLYIDNVMVGTVPSLSGGVWSYQIEKPLSVGSHTIVAVAINGTQSTFDSVTYTVPAGSYEIQIDNGPTQRSNDPYPIISGLTNAAEGDAVNVVFTLDSTTYGPFSGTVTSGKWRIAVPDSVVLSSGTYTVTATIGTVSDSIFYVLDTIPPVITLSGLSTVSITLGSSYSDAGATAADNIDNSDTITSKIVASNNVNSSIAGTYYVRYNVSDSFGNAAHEVIRTVRVLGDKPVIDPVKSQYISYAQIDSWEVPVPTVTDSVSVNLDPSYTIYLGPDFNSTTDLAGAKTYLKAALGNKIRITYTATNASNVAADPVSATFTSAEASLSSVTITGFNTVGETLTASIAPVGATVTYQWYQASSQDGTYSPITDATASKYIVTENERNKWLKVIAAGTGFYIDSVSNKKGPSPVIQSVSDADVQFDQASSWKEPTPQVTNPNNSNLTVSYFKGSLYEESISLASARTYLATANNKVKAVYSYPDAKSVSAIFTSKGVDLTSVSISRALDSGETLTATIAPTGATASYQWLYASSEVGTYTNITDATASSFTVTDTYLGKWLKVTATGTGNYSGSVNQTVKPRAVIRLTETNTVRFDQASSWNAPESTVDYGSGGAPTIQYYLGTDLATAVNLAAARAHLGTAGQKVKVVYSYTGALDASAEITSTSYSIQSVDISGTLKPGETISAAVTPSGATTSFQWYAADSKTGDFSEISEAKSSSYTIESTQQKKWIKVYVQGTGSYTGEAYKIIGPVAPAAPSLNKRTSDTLEVIADPDLEYSIDGTNWNTTGKFTGLDPNKSYSVYSRVKAVGDNPSSSSNALESKTKLKITFVDEDGETPLKTIEAENGDEVDLYQSANIPEKSGYKFINWQINTSNVDKSSKYKATDNTTVKAVFEPISQEYVAKDKDGKLGAKVSNLNQAVDQSSLPANKDWRVELDLEALEIKNVPAKDQEKIRDYTTQNLKNSNPGYFYFDVSLFMVTSDENGTTSDRLTVANDYITITMPVPQNLLGKDFTLLRIHDNMIDLEDLVYTFTDDAKTEIQFKTKKFSTYAYVYDEEQQTNDPDPNIDGGNHTEDQEPETTLAPGKVELETILKDPDTGTLTTDMKSYLSIPEQWMPTTQRVETWLDVHPVENPVVPAIKAPDSIIRTYDIKLMKRVTSDDGSAVESEVDPAQILHNIAVRLPLDATLQNAINLRVAVLMPDGQLAYLPSEIVTIDGQPYLAFENNVLSKILIVASGTMVQQVAAQSDFELTHKIPKTGEPDTRLAGALILFLALASFLIFKRRKNRVN